jgi:hypothetical protein
VRAQRPDCAAPLLRLVRSERAHGCVRSAWRLLAEARGEDWDYERFLLAFYNDPTVDAVRLAYKLLHSPRAPAQNVLHNLRFYPRNLPSTESDLGSLAAPAINDPRFVASSPSIVRHESGFLVNVRFVDYRVTPQGGYVYQDGHTLHTRNVALRLDAQLRFLEAEVVFDAFLPEERVRGLEDLKVVRTHSGLQCCGTLFVRGRPSMAVAPYPLRSLPRVVPSPEGRDCEKNWGLFEHRGRLHVLYQWWPLTIYDLEGQDLVNRRELCAPEICRHFRGSSNGCRWRDELWFVVHLVEFGWPRWYYNAIVVLDGDSLQVRRVSVPFKVTPQTPIEFILGLIVEDDRVLLTHSEHDRTAKLQVYERSIVDALF